MPLTLISKLLLSRPFPSAEVEEDDAPLPVVEEVEVAAEGTPTSLPLPLSKLASLRRPAEGPQAWLLLLLLQLLLLPLATRKKSSIVHENLNSKSAEVGAVTSNSEDGDDVDVEEGKEFLLVELLDPG